MGKPKYWGSGYIPRQTKYFRIFQKWHYPDRESQPDIPETIHFKMTNTYKTEAIIIKRINLGEADRIVTAFSSEFGNIRFVAKGVRRIKSKLAGSVEPFYKSNLLVATGRNLDILSSAEIVKTYLSLKPALLEIKTANLFGEIIR